MARRELLHKTKLLDFKIYLESIGYIEDKKNVLYQVLRMKKDNDMVIIYEKDNSTEHYTLQQKDIKLFYQYFNKFRK